MRKVVRLMILLTIGMVLILFLPEISLLFVSHNHEKPLDHKTETYTRAIYKDSTTKKQEDYWVNDSIYFWDDQQMNWISNGLVEAYKPNTENIFFPKTQTLTSNKLEWHILMNINYRLKYFQIVEAEMFSPIFGHRVRSFDEQEVIIKGFVIPFDEEGEMLALSYNPYSSCFFCGNASPASVISMYMKNPNTRYNIDEFKTFKGKLHLNQNDPNQFYYILKDCEPI